MPSLLVQWLTTSGWPTKVERPGWKLKLETNNRMVWPAMSKRKLISGYKLWRWTSKKVWRATSRTSISRPNLRSNLLLNLPKTCVIILLELIIPNYSRLRRMRYQSLVDAGSADQGSPDDLVLSSASQIFTTIIGDSTIDQWLNTDRNTMYWIHLKSVHVCQSRKASGDQLAVYHQSITEFWTSPRLNW